MVQSTAVMNNFSGGLKTEYTGLNFPENSCTDMSNCVISLIGEIGRREGINFEENYTLNNIAASNVAYSYYFWKNVGGDGKTEVLVIQVGDTLYFFEVSNTTETAGASTTLLGSTVGIAQYLASGNSNDPSQVECQFSDGNGYLFAFHPDLDPFFCTFTAGVITSSIITIQIRDFVGINDSMQNGNMISIRPPTLSTEHQYNLQNQGWTTGQPWSASTTTGLQNLPLGSVTFDVQTGITGIENGQQISIVSIGLVMGYATVTSYNSGSGVLVLDVYEVLQTGETTKWLFTPIDLGYITTWFSAEGTYPSNADQWWVFKDDTGTFNPATTAGNITLNSGQAPQGHYIFSAWDQDRTAASGVTGLTPVVTSVRPRTGTWFAGRVWYAGADSSQPATGDANYYTWTENIYFSQTVSDTTDFPSCYQVNDPTAEDLNSLLPTDGGVVVIQGCGGVHKLFTLQNGLLVFAQNGIWLISGSNGLGFTADNYSINKISAVQVLSSNSFVDIQGSPIFWNEEGIYMVMPNQDSSPYQFAGFKVEPITVGTILTFYNSIPKDSKRYAKGTYDPISYVAQWTYRTTQEAGISNRYQMDGVLSLNVFNRAFYPYEISSNNSCYIAGLQYLHYPDSLDTPDPTIKYITVVNGTSVTFAEENDSTSWFDWFSYDSVGVDYSSYFLAGYSLHGKGLLKWSNTYIYMYADNLVPYAYGIQGVWDYANSGNSGRYTNLQQVTNFSPNFNKMYRRHKIRGHGMALQLYLTSVSGQPFTFFGWAFHDDIDTSL